MKIKNRIFVVLTVCLICLGFGGLVVLPAPAQGGDNITNVGIPGPAPESEAYIGAIGFDEYTDFDPFQAAFDGQLTKIAFTEYPPGTVLTTQYFRRGITFTDSNDIILAGGFFVEDGFGVNGNGRVHLLLSEPAFAVGSAFPGGLTIELYDQPGGTLLYTSSNFAGTGTGFFGGVVTEAPFSFVVLWDWFDNMVFLDDIYVGFKSGWVGAYSKLLGDQSDLSLLRQYRDEYLIKSSKGKLYTELLYKSSEEVLEVLLDNPGLMARARKLIEANKDAVVEVLDGNRGVIYNTEEIISFLDAYARKSTASLRLLAITVKKEMLEKQEQGELFLGFELH